MKWLIAILYIVAGIITTLIYLFIMFRGKERWQYNDIFDENEMSFSLLLVFFCWPFGLIAEIVYLVSNKISNNKDRIFDILYKVVNMNIKNGRIKEDRDGGGDGDGGENENTFDNR